LYHFISPGYAYQVIQTSSYHCLVFLAFTIQTVFALSPDYDFTSAHR